MIKYKTENSKLKQQGRFPRVAFLTRGDALFSTPVHFSLREKSSLLYCAYINCEMATLCDAEIVESVLNHDKYMYVKWL